jgi:hypothetical protein
MKRALIAGLCLAALCGPARAQIPVTDVASITQLVKQYAVQAKQLATQAQQYTAQAQQLYAQVQQLEAFVHDPSLGAAMGLLNQAGLGNDLPINPYALQSLTSGYGGIMGKIGVLGSLVNTSYGQNHVYSPTDGSWNSQQLIANGNAIAGTQGAAEATYQDLRNHMAVIQALRERLLTATTPKDVADAQAQLETEILWTQSLNSQLAAIQVNYQAQVASNTQRDNESLAQGIDSFLADAQAAGRGVQP